MMAINRALPMTTVGPKLSVADVKNLVMMNVSAAAQNHAIFVVYLGTWRRIAGRKMEKIKATVERGRRRGHLAILRVAGAREAGHHAGRQAGRRGAILAAGQHPQETAEVEARAEDVPRRNLADSRSFRKHPRLTCRDRCSYCSALLVICKMHRRADQISPIFRQTHRLFPGLNISARLFWLQVQSYQCQAPLLSIIWQCHRSWLPARGQRSRGRRCIARPRPGRDVSPQRFLRVCSDLLLLRRDPQLRLLWQRGRRRHSQRPGRSPLCRRRGRLLQCRHPRRRHLKSQDQ